MSAKPRAIKILHFSPTSRDVGCGVARYQEAYMAGMRVMPGVENKFFDVSPYQTRPMQPVDFEKVIEQLKEELKDYDILHIQHEFALYWHNQFARIVETGKAAGKKVIVTLHLSPANVKEIAPVKLNGLDLQDLTTYIREMRHHKRMVAYHVAPLLLADVVIAHTAVTARYLETLGIQHDHIKLLPHPVYEVPTPPVTTDIARWLNKEPGDSIFCITGFLHRQKHIEDAIHALKFLPANYKLALLGGVKEDSDDLAYENKLTDLIDMLGVKDRVYISGFVPSDTLLDSYVRECDVCVYPYDKVYYSNASSGALGLAFSNAKPIIAYPTASVVEAAQEVEGAIVLCQTFSYYELARELQRIDLKKQATLSKQYAEKLAWARTAQQMPQIYKALLD